MSLHNLYKFLFSFSLIITKIQADYKQQKRSVIPEEYQPYTINMDDNIYYSQIMPFSTEWRSSFNGTKFQNAPSPVNIWLTCIDKELRGYFHIEDLRFRLVII